MGGGKKPSWQYFIEGGHGKTVMASVRVREETLRRVLRTSTADLVALEHIASQGGHASGMQSVAFTPASAVAALFAPTGQDLGMVGTSSMAQDVVEAVPGGVHVGMRFGGLGWHARRWHGDGVCAGISGAAGMPGAGQRVSAGADYCRGGGVPGAIGVGGSVVAGQREFRHGALAAVGARVSAGGTGARGMPHAVGPV